ncbi:polymeric immunoglobulin receptor-like [Morone saxatilis]|uniref:polymeric immunoglobulin receptor-like n=1 Tax=Morone saxatilis TaxID=34816 RepID=UPI0015E1F68E|nr:polymeric immunoglobulin receptor-like [Morone saxatilis]
MMPLCIFLVLLSEICQVPAVDKTSGITQDSGVITAEVGQSVTLKCLCRNDAVNFFFWYQQSLGGKPLIISTWMKHSTEATISPAYERRFQVLAEEEGINHLVITDLRLSDSATYYCGILEFNEIEFGQGAFLHVKTSLSNIHAVVHQPELETFRWGDSVNLSCTVYTEKCAGEQNLYWFRHGVAQPAIMYHNAGKCMKDSHMENCTLNLAIKSVSSSDAGMYYCALASCGEIVFGQGTRVKIAGSTSLCPGVLSELAVSIILLLVLALVMYKLKKKICSVCKGTVSHLTCSAASDTTSQDADALHYAALSLKRTSERHRQEESVESVCVYSRVKSSRVK